MREPIVIDNLFDDEFHNLIIKELKYKAKWTLSFDDIPEGYSDAGFVCYSWVQNPNPDLITDLPNANAWAYLIFNKVVTSNPSVINNPELIRYVWNYYNSSSSGSKHIDHNEPNYYSIVYNLTTCNNAGTYIEDKFYESKAGRALLFPSNITHKGVGPTDAADKRFVLNIMFYNH